MVFPIAYSQKRLLFSLIACLPYFLISWYRVKAQILMQLCKVKGRVHRSLVHSLRTSTISLTTNTTTIPHLSTTKDDFHFFFSSTKHPYTYTFAISTANMVTKHLHPQPRASNLEPVSNNNRPFELSPPRPPLPPQTNTPAPHQPQESTTPSAQTTLSQILSSPPPAQPKPTNFSPPTLSNSASQPGDLHRMP